MNMKLNQTNFAFDHKITSGSEYTWTCWDDARYLDYESEYAHVSVVYNTKTQSIYQAEVSVKPEMWSTDMQPYRWLDPLSKDAYMEEATKRGVDPDQAWDNVNWVDLEVEEDFLEKATAIFNGDGDFDTRIQVPLDLEDDLILQLAMEAHKRDITLNKMVEILLQQAIDQHKGNSNE
jgi:hypothetical protein